MNTQIKEIKKNIEMLSAGLESKLFNAEEIADTRAEIADLQIQLSKLEFAESEKKNPAPTQPLQTASPATDGHAIFFKSDARGPSKNPRPIAFSRLTKQPTQPNEAVTQTQKTPTPSAKPEAANQTDRKSSSGVSAKSAQPKRSKSERPVRIAKGERDETLSRLQSYICQILKSRTFQRLLAAQKRGDNLTAEAIEFTLLEKRRSVRRVRELCDALGPRAGNVSWRGKGRKVLRELVFYTE